MNRLSTSASFWILAAAALGLLLALVDTSPGWDDTGISVGTLVILGGFFGALAPLPPWASALAVGCSIPILNLYQSGNAQSLMVLPIALAAAYGGRAIRKALT